jgi:hypothetical protein
LSLQTRLVGLDGTLTQSQLLTQFEALQAGLSTVQLQSPSQLTGERMMSALATEPDNRHPATISATNVELDHPTNWSKERTFGLL